MPCPLQITRRARRPACLTTLARSDLKARRTDRYSGSRARRTRTAARRACRVRDIRSAPARAALRTYSPPSSAMADSSLQRSEHASRMLTSVLLAIFTGAAIGQQMADLDPCDGACACVDGSQSNGWHDGGTGQDRVSLRIIVPGWDSGMKVTATWPEVISVDDVYGADQLLGEESDAHAVTFTLSESTQPGSNAAFVVMGHGSKHMPTSFLCASAPNITSAASTGHTSSSAVADADCDLGARYVTVNARYPKLVDAKVALDKWETGRVIVLSFASQDFNPVNPQYATIRDTDIGENTVITFELASLGSERLCQTGHVNSLGAYVRDTNCASAKGGRELFFSFQLQCPTCTSAPDPPQVICHELSPPPPAPYIASTVLPQQLPAVVQPNAASRPIVSQPVPSFSGGAWTIASPPPPPLLSPPPSPPRVVATACASGGMAVVQRRVRGQGEQETLHIVVSPSHWWPTGYVYVIGIRGLNLNVWKPVRAIVLHDWVCTAASRAFHTPHVAIFVLCAMRVQVGAALLPHEQQNFDEMAVHHFTFSPEPAHPNFGFNVDGVDVFLDSLTCSLPDAPPSPPLYSPPPPAPSPPVGLQMTFGVRSLSSRLAVSIITMLAVARLAAIVWHSRHVRACRRALCGGDGGRAVISATDSGARGETGMAAGDDGCWAVLFDVNGREVELSLPLTVATNTSELREALADLAGEALGSKVMPTAWASGDLRTMRVQYVDADEQPLTLRDSTRFSAVCDSPYLRVTLEAGSRA